MTEDEKQARLEELRRRVAQQPRARTLAAIDDPRTPEQQAADLAAYIRRLTEQT